MAANRVEQQVFRKMNLSICKILSSGKNFLQFISGFVFLLWEPRSFPNKVFALNILQKFYINTTV
jgi:hypothetical protein